MPELIRAHDNHNQPIVAPGRGPLALCHFNLVRLAAGERCMSRAPGCESVCVVLSGTVDILVAEATFASIGQRADVWSGRADSVYVPLDAEAEIVNTSATPAEIAIAGGRATRRLTPFRVRPEEIEMVEVGSATTHSRRRIFHILGQNTADRVDRLLVSELLADPGCWSGYPPHKHDTENPPEETDFEEIYHYRFRPETGFGGQFSYEEGGAPRGVLTRHGDTFLIDRGHHPTVTSPGHEGYIFTILAGRHQRSLIQNFDPTHRHLMSAIPGIQAMRDKFK